jgi:hypothetical protein
MKAWFENTLAGLGEQRKLGGEVTLGRSRDTPTAECIGGVAIIEELLVGMPNNVDVVVPKDQSSGGARPA